MTIKYDKEVDIICLQFSDSQIVESDEEKPGMIIDYDENGNIVGIEYLEASQKMKKPDHVLYEVVNGATSSQ